MSIALSTLVLFFLLIPGVLFRRLYYTEEFSRQYFKETFSAVFIATIVPSLLFQVIWYFLAKSMGYEVDLTILGDLVSREPKTDTFQNIMINSGNIIWYNLSMFIVAGLSGYTLKKIVRAYHLDRSFKFFRFQNSWHYILQGEFFDFPRAKYTLVQDTVEDIEFVFVDAIVQIGNDSYLYDGILVDYNLSSDGGLETISLSNTKRRNLSDDSKINNKGKKEDNSSKYYPITGHILVLKYSEIKNLNFKYLTLEVDENEKFSLRQVK